MSASQQTVLALAKEEHAKKLSELIEINKAYYGLRRQQTQRLLNLIERQREDRLRMKDRHKQEETSLDQVIKLPENNQNETLTTR